MYQQITLVGNLGADPEMRSTQGGTEVCNLNVATSNKYRNRDGEMVDDTTWFRVAVWGKQAESCAKYLEKGSKVLVTGRVGARAFIGRDGDARASLEVNASTVKFLSTRNEEGQPQTRTESGPKADDYANDDGDIPF